MTDLTELKRLRAEATAGEWSISDDGTCGTRVNWIAAMHNAFPQLAATIETQEKEIERLTKELIEARAEHSARRAM